jgi:hypothetical protein
LLRYVEREEGKAAQADLFARATQLAAEQEEAKAKAEADAAAAAALAASPLPGQEELEYLLKSTKDITEVYPSFLELVKLATGATSAYIGVKGVRDATDEEPALPVISFIAGSEGSNIEGSMLLGQPEDDPDAKAEGVTFDLFVGTEPPETDEPTEGDDGEEPGLIYPEEVVVSNVVRDSRVKFFGVPSIGAYAAVPMKFKSCLHADGVDEADTSNQNPVYQDRDMVLGFHTMKQAGRQFTQEEISKAKYWVTKLAEASERAELTIWTEEVVKQEEAIAQEKEVGDAIAKAKAEAAATCEEATAALSEDMIPEIRDFEAKKLAYAAALSVLQVVEDKLEEAADRRMPLKPDQVRIMHAMLYTLLEPKEAFVESASRKVSVDCVNCIEFPFVIMVLSFSPSLLLVVRHRFIGER